MTKREIERISTIKKLIDLVHDELCDIAVDYPKNSILFYCVAVTRDVAIKLTGLTAL